MHTQDSKPWLPDGLLGPQVAKQQTPLTSQDPSDIHLFISLMATRSPSAAQRASQ